MNRIVLFVGVLLNATLAKAQLKINEVMQSNIDMVFDELNEIPDSWVELYNGGGSTVNLSDYYIGIKEKFNKAYRLPAQTIEAGRHVLVLCDKTGEGMHADFRLESGKDGEIYLFDALGNIVDKITGMKKQPAPNVAYGRETDGADTWGYMLTPTPGQTNSGGVASKLLPDPVFSIPGCVYTGPSRARLTLSLPDDAPDNAVIRYTTDGTAPTQQSPAYTKAIVINKTTTIRARLFCEGWLTAQPVTQSYIYHGREQTLPIISMVTDPGYFYDNNIGIYVDGTYSNEKKNFEYDWRRPANIEFFMTAGNTADINQLCETRVCGGYSRNAALRSLAVYANKRFGEKRFDCEFFPGQRPGATDFKSLMLRNAGNDFDYLYFRDAAIQYNMAKHCDIDWQAWQPAAVYLNGTYMGMLNIRERSNEDNIYTNYNGLEDIDMFENWWELKTGTWDNYNAFKEFYTDPTHTNAAEYEKWMDVTEFSNLMIMNIFHCNLDFPGNNIVMWRPTAEDGKWRWIAKDTDFGLGLYGRSHEYRYIDWLYDNNYDPDNNWANTADYTRLFRRLMSDNTFKQSFLERMCIYMGDFLNGETLGHTLDSMYNVVKTEYAFHRKLFNEWWPNHQEELDNAKKWASNRTAFMYDYINTYYAMGGYSNISVNADMTQPEAENITLYMNGVHIGKGRIDMRFFNNHTVKITGTSKDPALEVAGWNVEIHRGTDVETVACQGNTISVQMPQCDMLKANAVLKQSTGIDNAGRKREFEISVDGNMVSIKGLTGEERASVCDIAGKYVMLGSKDGNLLWKAPHPGIYIIKAGGTVRKIMVKYRQTAT